MPSLSDWGDSMSREFEPSARAAALRILSVKPYTMVELRKKLLRKGYHSSDIETVLKEFVANGYLNDREYAERFAENKRLHSFHGKRMIAFQLKAKGLPQEIIDDAVTSDHSEEDEYQLASDAAEKKLQQWRAFGKKKDLKQLRMKLFSFLQRRGFPNRIVHGVIKAHIPYESSEDDFFDTD